MAGIIIFLLISFLLFFILTRKVWVTIIKDKTLKVEIHLPIFALHLTKSNDGDKRKKSDMNEKISYLGYFRIITCVVARLKKTEIIVKKVILPVKTEDFDKSALIRPLRQHAFICAFVAYLRTKTEKLTLEDNAIILSPDTDVLHCYVTLKLRLYEFIHGLLAVMHSIFEEKRRIGFGKNARE